MDVREQVVIGFLAAAIVTTVGLGGVVAYQFAHPSSDRAALRVVAPGSGSASGGAAGATAAPDPATTTSPGGGGASAGAAAPAPGSSASAPAPGGAPAASSGHGRAGVPVPLPPGPAPGVSGGVITVGGIYDETGPLDATVERDTVRAYFNGVNAAGGVNGYRFRLIDCDSAFDPTRGHQCSERLVGTGVLAMVGWLSASSEQAETAYLTTQGIPMIGGLGVPSEFESPLSFPVASNLLGPTVEGVSSHAVDLGIHAPAVVVIHTPFTAPAPQRISESLHRHGIHEKSIDFADATKPDYTDLAVKIRLESLDHISRWDSGLTEPLSFAPGAHDPNHCLQWIRNQQGTWHTYSGWNCF